MCKRFLFALESAFRSLGRPYTFFDYAPSFCLYSANMHLTFSILLLSVSACVHARPQFKRQQFTGVATFNNYAVYPPILIHRDGEILTQVQAQGNVNCGGPLAPCKPSTRTSTSNGYTPRTSDADFNDSKPPLLRSRRRRYQPRHLRWAMCRQHRHGTLVRLRAHYRVLAP